MIVMEVAMTHKELQALLLKRMKELDRWYAEDPPDPEKTVDTEHGVVWEVVEEMARAGFPRLHKAGLALLTNRKAKRAKSYLSHCLKALRQERPARSKGVASDSAMLTPPQVAKRYGVSADTVRRWITSGNLRAVNVGEGKQRPRHRVSAEALKDFDAKRPPRVAPKAPPQRRRRRQVDLPFTRYTSRQKASPERGR
jgi:excisionase family DNA binding protein